jgi:aromatic-amino-acid transaminase
MSESVLAGVAMAPRDPILGITEAFNADDRPTKVNLGVGVYYDESGKIPLLECVRRAERQLVETARPRGYLPIDGMPAYDQAVRTLVFGADHPAVAEKRVITVQTLGGTGGLKVGADLLRRIAPNAAVWISEPSWENHRALFENAGFTVETYPYYDAATKGVRFPALLEGLRKIPSGDVVVLHACCHNPTGVDLAPSSGRRSVTSSWRAASFRSSTWPTRASPTGSKPMPLPSAPSRRRPRRSSCRVPSRSRSRSTASGSAASASSRRARTRRRARSAS